jgi:hemolysin D
MPLKLLKPKDDSHQFQPMLAEIEEDPGSPLGPLTFWAVVAVFGFFLIWSIMGQVDVVVSARGKVVPSGQVKLIQPLNGGVVGEILVKEGDLVHQGQPLVIIDPSTTAPQLASSQETLAHVQAEQSRLQAATGQGSFASDSGTQSRLYSASLAALTKQLQAKEKALAGLSQQMQAKLVDAQMTRETLAINQQKEVRLQAVKDIIAREDYEKVQTEIITGQNKLKALAHELEQLRFQQQQIQEEMAFLKEEFESKSLTELSDKEKQITQLKASIQESSFKHARQTLVAPVDGYVHELFIHTVGGVVTPAQKILSIVPLKAPLDIEAIVANKDIGFVKVGMPVAIKVDTFDFQKYGTLKGKVTRIDPDSKDDPKQGPIYTMHVSPEQQQLFVDGHWQALKAGLSVTGEVKTGKRRIIEFFIYPLIKHLDEGLSVR